jgi:hypothetical protein
VRERRRRKREESLIKTEGLREESLIKTEGERERNNTTNLVKQRKKVIQADIHIHNQKRKKEKE